jgi:MinD-like ATPase involved in chromosome partitioning or flagellar assembly
MSAAAHVENLADDDRPQPQTDPDPRLAAGGQLARVGRRHGAAVSGRPLSDAAPDLHAEPREEPDESHERAEVRMRPVRRDDLYDPRASLCTRVVSAAARWLTSSRGEVSERELDARLRDRAANSRMNVATVTGQRGGVGKTSLVVTVGGLLADIARLNVVALDADLDYGPLADHVPDQHRSEKTIVDLLADFDADQPVAMPRLRPYLSRTPSGLRVLAAPRRREEMRELTAADLDRALALLSNFDLCLLDCAAGVERDLAPWATSRAHRLIIVTTAEYVGARNVGRAISELPLENAILAINKLKATGNRNDPPAALVRRVFAGLLEQRFTVRHDEQLHQMLDQARLDIDRLGRATRVDLKRLAVEIAEGLA